MKVNPDPLILHGWLLAMYIGSGELAYALAGTFLALVGIVTAAFVK